LAFLDGFVDLADDARANRAVAVGYRYPDALRVRPPRVTTVGAGAGKSGFLEPLGDQPGGFLLDHEASLVC